MVTSDMDISSRVLIGNKSTQMLRLYRITKIREPIGMVKHPGPSDAPQLKE